MSRTSPTRRELVTAIIAQGRTNSTTGILLHATIAERLGLNPSDLKCADLMVSQCDDCTPGRLAELTGLSTGTITGVIDRLERAGFLVREHDPFDRRRVLLRLTRDRAPEVESLFLPLARGVEQLAENYTIAELTIALRFMRDIDLVTQHAAEQLREGKMSAASSQPSRKPAARDRRPAAPSAGRGSSESVRSK
jgi:DNA-binding MarR family transcriptional regulator